MWRKRQLSARARKFLREVGSIVLGVLIALGLGEVADAVRLRVSAKRALAAVRADMIDNAVAFDLQTLRTACANRRLDVLTAELDAARRTGKLRDIGEIGGTAPRTFRSGSWESAVANGDTLYLDKELVADTTDYHVALQIFRSEEVETGLGWARLGVLTHAPGPIDDNTLSSARQTIAELRYHTKTGTMAAAALREMNATLLVPLEYTSYNGQPWTRSQAFQMIRQGPLCRPLEIDGTQTATRGE